MSASHSGGNWTIGTHGAIVTDEPYEDGLSGYDAVDYYGGYMIAESVSPCNRPIFSASADMYRLLCQLEVAGDVVEGLCIVCCQKPDAHLDWCDIGKVLRKARGEAS